MKKAFLSIALILIAQLSMAQEANFKADVLKLISISGADGAMKVAKLQILNIIPENKKENFSKEFDSSLPSMYEKIVKVYMEIYTPEDIKGMIVFYESPVGKKMSEKSGELTQKTMKAGQEWGRELQVIMKRYKDADSSQDTTDLSGNTIYNTAGIEIKPEFPGGMDQFYKFISENFITPKVEKLAGKVYVTFVVEKDGSLTDIKVLRDIGYGTGKEAIRVLKISPKWLPGQQNGKTVRCTYSLPISVKTN